MRPEIITRKLIEEICNYIAAGYSYSAAAKLAGIAESTFFRWRAMGQLEGAEEIYVVFYLEVEEASAFSEAEALQLVRSAAIKERNWRAAAWFLERRFPERYQKRNSLPDSDKPENFEGVALAS
jgi:transposase